MKNNARSSNITRLALLAVGNKDAAQLWMMTGCDIGKDFVIGVPASAHIAILDGDADGSRDALEKWKAEHPSAPAVVFSERPGSESSDVVHVPKPLRLPELAAILSKLRSGGHREAAAPQSGRTRLPVQGADQAVLANRKPVPSIVNMVSGSGSEVLSVDICMSMDPVEVLDTIGIETDISGDFPYPSPMGGRASQVRVAA